MQICHRDRERERERDCRSNIRCLFEEQKTTHFALIANVILLSLRIRFLFPELDFSNSSLDFSSSPSLLLLLLRLLYLLH